MPLLLIALAAVLFYLAFSVNVFGFGLMMYDDASEDVFKDLSERRKRRLNRFFSNITRFKYFVQIFNNFALVVIALLIYRVTVHIFAQNAVVRAAITIAAIVLLWLIFLTVVQFFSKRVSARWIVNTLIKKQTLMSLLYGLFTPFILVFMKTLDIYKGEKIPDDKKEELVERAIESMADEVGIEEPLMEEDEKEMIENIFELDQTSVKAVMVPRIDIVSLHSRMGLEEIKEIVRNSGHSRFPVYGEDADDVLGFLYVKDLFCRDAVKDEKFNIREYIRKAYVIPETKRLDELLEELKRSRTHIALVVDEYGGTAGIVTMENIIEVIVGDIQDEHDYEHPDIVRLESGEVRVNANVSVEDLAEYL
ncbi:MAG TPA: HlyC/CorC family transporter, partial [candidate division Zixibacteria bacterium]|nr:HlyC/CorC family transporter [candidate division Zixibacteria bacterium]